MQDPAVQAAIDDTVDDLLTYDDWAEREGNEFRQFRREDKGLSTIRVTVFGQFKPMNNRPARRRVRVVGLYRPDENPSRFIFLGGFEKTLGGFVRTPADAIDQAKKRKQQFEENRGSVREHI